MTNVESFCLFNSFISGGIKIQAIDGFFTRINIKKYNNVIFKHYIYAWNVC